MAQNAQLRLLRDRLNTITIPKSAKEDSDPSNPTAPKIKIEKGCIDPSLNKYICGECGKSHGSLSYLTYHYHRSHDPVSYVCPVADCPKWFQSEGRMTGHLRRYHSETIPGVRTARIACQHPGCLQKFTMRYFFKHLQTHTDEAAHRGYYKCQYAGCKERFPDLTRLTQHAYQVHTGIAVARCCLECHMKFDSDEKLYCHYRRDHPFLGSESFNCPLGCRSFRNADDLYRHYWDSSHPTYLRNEAPLHLPFRCPFEFCARAYSSEIGLGIHNALAHGTKIGGITMAVIKPIFQNALKPASKAVQVASEGHLDESIECTAGADLVDPVEINEQGAIQMGSGILNNLEFDELAGPTSYSQLPAPPQRPIGYVVENPRSSKNSKEAALHQQEQALQSNQVDDDVDFPIKNLGREILHRILVLLQVDEDLSVEELYEIWSVFLLPVQRCYVLLTLTKLNIREPSEDIIARLRGSGLAAVISAWIRFKSLLDQSPPHLREAAVRNPHSLGHGTAWAILMHCMLLEGMRATALPEALRIGLKGIPDRLRFPSQGSYYLSQKSSFAEILDALAERAKCRKVHPEGMQMTNAMVLEEVRKYRDELREVVLAVYPGIHDTPEWLQMFGRP